jgi:lipid-binding SYLF domain-containing protein
MLLNLKRKKTMPNFQLATEKEAQEVEKPREFIAVPVLNGNTDKLKDVLGQTEGQALVLVLPLNGEMPVVNRTRKTKNGGESTSAFYGESRGLFSGINDDGTPIKITVVAKRKVAGDDDDDEETGGTNGNATV